MSLKERITEDMKAALRAGEKERLGTLRLILAALKQKEVDENIAIEDGHVLSTLEKMIKQRKESIAQFEAGGRKDLVDKEQAEVLLIQGYLPAPLSETELDALILEAIASSGAASIKDMGKAMAIVKAKAAGRADMSAVGAKLKAKLSG